MIRILFLLTIIIFFYFYYFYKNEYIELFTEKIPDDIYANLNYLVFSYQPMYDNDCKQISRILKKNHNKILICNIGNTRHIKSFMNYKNEYFIIDNNISSINLLKKHIPIIKNIKYDDILKPNTYKNKQFDAICALHQPIYECNKSEFGQKIANINFWLKDDGLLFITIFDRNKLDPGPREYSMYYTDNNNNYHSLTYFKDLTHDAYFNIEDNEYVIYNEKFILKNGKTKEKISRLYIPNKDVIFNLLHKNNFKHLSELNNNDDNEELKTYVFKKYKSYNNYISI